jgi:dihydrofolate reductase
MRKVIAALAVSLDGFIEGPKGEYDWCFTDQDYGMTDFLNRIDTVFYGRKSYEVMLAAEHGGNNPFATYKNYVFSNTIGSAFEGTSLISGDVHAKVIDIKGQNGKDIWLFGGTSLVSWFLEEGLVDELSLAVHPLILGSGKPLFKQINKSHPLVLLSSTPYSSGLVILHYQCKEKD